MFRNYKKGFTLIELLVVIAIIGILSSVVLASLNTARQRGADAAIRATVNNARAQAELYFDGEGDYDDVCLAGTASNPGLAEFVAAAREQSGDVDCNDTTTEWALSAQLVSDAGVYYCVDSSGVAEELGAPLRAATACN
jgi:prepilin-type N-terminal cleavage/methylation domain-containing protein